MLLGIDMSKYTRTERRIVDLLMDGQVHSIGEVLQKCFDDDLATLSNLSPHLASVRKKVSEVGLLINCVIPNGRRSKGYQMSRRLSQD